MAREFRSILEYLSDDVERPYLLAAMEGKLDDAGRLTYANLLGDRDPTRAAWIRLEVQLHAQATDDANVRARFVELGREIGYDFRHFFNRKNILNCGSTRKEPRRVRFSFVCDKRWETLSPTDDTSVRHCDTCQSRVYRCTTVREAETRARAGECIAVPRELVNHATGNNYQNMVGRPNPLGDWGDIIFPNE